MIAINCKQDMNDLVPACTVYLYWNTVDEMEENAKKKTQRKIAQTANRIGCLKPSEVNTLPPELRLTPPRPHMTISYYHLNVLKHIAQHFTYMIK